MNNKRVVVTGGGRGIGAAVAAELRSRGADVVTADVQPGVADVTCDVSDADQVAALFAGVGAIDGVVTSAALLVGRRPFEEIDVDDWDRMFAINVRGTFLCARAGAAVMGAGGSIVTISSETAFTGSRGFVHYVASKGAVISMTRALANELGPRGVRVNCVAPGFTVTPGSDVLGEYDPARTPLGRVMVPDDLLGTFCYLLSDDSAFVTGQTVVVDGGRYAH